MQDARIAEWSADLEHGGVVSIERRWISLILGTVVVTFGLVLFGAGLVAAVSLGDGIAVLLGAGLLAAMLPLATGNVRRLRSRRPALEVSALGVTLGLSRSTIACATCSALDRCGSRAAVRCCRSSCRKRSGVGTPDER